MANTISSDLIPNIVGVAKETMKESFAFASRLNKDFSGAAAVQGQVVNVGVPAKGAAVAITPANVAPDGSAKTIGSRSITIDQFYGSDPVKLTNTENASYSLSSVFEQQIQEAVRQVAYKFNSTVWAKAELKIPRIAGTATQSIFNNGTSASTDPLADVYKKLRDNNVDPALYDMIVTTQDEANAKKVDSVKNANQYGSTMAGVDGSVGRVQGFNIFADQQAKKHTIGTITAGLITKAATAQALGTTSVVCTTASGGACALKAGDNITIAGYEYVVQADATEASASTDVTVSIFPGLKVAAAGSEAVTLTTGAGTAYFDVAGDLRGISAVARLPQTNILGIATMGDHYPIVEANSGLPMLLSFYSQFNQVMFQASLLYGVDITDEDKLVKAYTHA